MYEAVDIFLFIILLGSFINIFQESGALVSGLSYTFPPFERKKLADHPAYFSVSLGGSTYGMQEEALVFYPVITHLSRGRDMI
jgi:uncharacterized ion transporter superfamily protein YfcC